MGRGRQKAKHTKIARELTSYSPSVNSAALERELGPHDDDEYGDTWADQYADDDEDALESEIVARQGNYPNPDYPSGPAYNLIGIDTLTFTPLFIAARITGWTAHVIEQQASNALIRPLSAYNGPDERHVAGYVPDTAAVDVQERVEEAAE